MPYELDIENADYRARVQSAVMDAISNGASTLTAICRQSRGAFPPIVRDLVEGIGVNKDGIPHRAWLDEDPGMFDSALPAMPEPHPVDYEWRYAAATADALAEYLNHTAKRVGCFGTPTVFWRLRQMGADATLFDRNEGLRQYLRTEDRPHLRVQDLLQNPSEQRPTPGKRDSQLDAVILDPPWYLDHMLTWVAKAVRCLRPGGKLVCTIFPDLIRPSAFDERNQLLSALGGLGPVAFLPFPALYTTPLFEHETLSAFGLADLGQWRSAEFVSVTVGNPALSFPHRKPAQAHWTKVQLGSQIIAVREELSERSRDQTLRFVAPESDGSFLLKSVSARDPVRKNVSVWTSRNRALVATHGGSEVLPFLADLASGRSPEALLRSAPSETGRALQILLALIGW